ANRGPRFAPVLRVLGWGSDELCPKLTHYHFFFLRRRTSTVAYLLCFEASQIHLQPQISRSAAGIRSLARFPRRRSHDSLKAFVRDPALCPQPALRGGPDAWADRSGPTAAGSRPEPKDPGVLEPDRAPADHHGGRLP